MKPNNIDVIKERASLFKCPICNNILSLKTKEVEYNGQKIKICETHTIQGEK